MSLRAGSVCAALWLLGLVSGCGSAPEPRATFILLPDDDGTAGQITVSNPAGSRVLDTPYAAVEVAASQTAPATPAVLDPASVESRFGPALRATPPDPVHFLLYFEADSTELTAASRARLEDLLAAVRARPLAEVSVVGHTDTLGAKDYNYRLSLQRAEAVGELLRELGVASQDLAISSHGEENLLVPTPDEVAEPRNRRVAITVR